METIYRQLQRKFNSIGLGLPETDEGYELNYLAELFTEEEAEFVLKMERGMQTAEEVAASMNIPAAEAAKQLESMAKRNNIFRVRDGEQVKYTIFPIIHGFLEFNVDRFNSVIAKNFGKHYMKGMGRRFYGSQEPLFRVLPIRAEAVEDGGCLDADDVEAIIRRQTRIALTPCFCRTSTQSSPKATGCTHNRDFHDTCMVFGIFADFYLENGNATEITVAEALEHIRRCDGDGNIVEVLNTRDVEVMCSCCPCCCGVMKALMFFGGPSKEVASNYKIRFNESACVQCGKCSERCFMKALEKGEDGKVTLIEHNCVGCGLCATTCPAKALTLHRKPEEAVYLPPTDSVVELYDHITSLRRASYEI